MEQQIAQVEQAPRPGSWFGATLRGRAASGEHMSVPLADASRAEQEARRRGLIAWEVLDRTGQRVATEASSSEAALP